jgi:TolB-like protein
MPDIFLSYSREDQAVARRFAEQFERAGFSVWWDATLRSGDDYDAVTEAALRGAKAVVVLWSRRSVTSRWVRAEATVAERNRTLVPVMIEDCERPVMFELKQTADLVRWSGDGSDPHWAAVLSDVRLLVAGPRHPGIASPATPASHNPGPSRLRIAVLPFINFSPDPNNAFFADGLHDEILTTIANSTVGLEVVSRTTMMTYRTAPKAAAEVARELGATHVLEGSVRREHDNVRMRLQLVEGASDRLVWKEDYDRQLVSAMTLQAEVAREVSRQLSVQLEGSRDSSPPSRDTLAYDLYLKAKLAFREMNSGTHSVKLSEVEDTLTQALRHDADFVPARVERAQVGLARYALGIDHRDEYRKKIKSDIDAASRLAPRSPEVLAARAQYAADVDEDLGSALALFDHAERAGLRETSTFDGKGRNSVLRRMGRTDEAIAGLRRQIVTDPGNVYLYHDWSASEWSALRPAEAVRVIDLQIGQQRPGIRDYSGYRADLLFAFTGDLTPWRAISKAARAAWIDNEFLLGIEMYFLARDEGTAVVERLLAAVHKDAVRPGPFSGDGLYGAGQRPVAEYRGWIAMLKGDLVGARDAGTRVLEFIASEPARRQNDWFLTLLAGAAHVFAGNFQQAQASAGAGLALMPASRNAINHRYAAFLAARIYAWCGAAMPAVALLERLATQPPGVGPATIVRDPLISKPLAESEPYQALSARLEAQIRSNVAAGLGKRG